MGDSVGSLDSIAAPDSPVCATERRIVSDQSECLEQLMVRYQQADDDAAAELIEKLSPRLFSFFARSTSTRVQAEDWLQECWLRVHKARHSYRPGAPVLPWIYGVARYTRLDGLRRLQRDRVLEELKEETLACKESEASMHHSKTELWHLLGKLPQSQQEVILLQKVVGLSQEEVARATGSTVGSVKQRAHRGYRNLRSALQGQGVE